MEASAAPAASNPVTSTTAAAAAAAAVAAQDTNGTVAGGAAGAWTNQGLAPGAGMSVGGAGAMSASKPAADAPKTRKKGLSVSAPKEDNGVQSTRPSSGCAPECGRACTFCVVSPLYLWGGVGALHELVVVPRCTKYRY